MKVMSERARKLLQDAMELPVQERTALIVNLLATLDSEPDEGVEAAWQAEVELRAREAFANPEDDVAWETVRAELHSDAARG